MFVIDEIYNDNLNDSNILVIGDIIYDNYIFGEASRLSLEAPVPIFKPNSEEYRLGGAANVFNNILSLGANVHLCGIVGKDPEGAKIKTKILKMDSSSFILESAKISTTKKTRLIVGNQHLLRIDEERNFEIDEKIETEVFNFINDKINLYNLLVVSDYNKGFLKHSLVKKIVKLFNERKKKVLVDSKADIYKYSDAYLVKPNIYELSKIVKDNSVYEDNISLINHSKTILAKGNFKYIYVTMGDKGGVLVDRYENVHFVPVFGNKALDITGAGDSTLAAIAVAISARSDICSAVNFASYVAGISVSKTGTSIVTKSDLHI